MSLHTTYCVLTICVEPVWTSDLPTARKRALSPTTDAVAQLAKQKKAKGRSSEFLYT